MTVTNVEENTKKKRNRHKNEKDQAASKQKPQSEEIVKALVTFSKQIVKNPHAETRNSDIQAITEQLSRLTKLLINLKEPAKEMTRLVNTSLLESLQIVLHNMANRTESEAKSFVEEASALLIQVVA